jgi:DNA-binding transcriptional regulator YdaS (Cro superfamily)
MTYIVIMTKFRTTREIIAALGGASKLAPRLGIGRTAIQNWIANEYIPVHAADAIREALKEVEATCPDELFRPRLTLRSGASA